ncbi:MAG: HD domain-containing protein [Lachnospiraceae bacterium]|nr:HD domain-containing protein [Lachnospiraceae bacterium]
MVDRLNKQFDFIREIDKEKLIGRQNYLIDASRKENDAEHAWHLALMAVLLSEYSNEPIDVLKTVTMVLIHDIVEIDAGDTYAYDDAAHNDKRERELKAADRIFGLLPEDQAKKLRELWDEFEANESPEAKFAHSLDHIQPMMLNDASGGKSWLEHGIRLSQVLKRNENTGDGSEALWEYARDNILMPNAEKGTLVNDKADDINSFDKK